MRTTGARTRVERSDKTMTGMVLGAMTTIIRVDYAQTPKLLVPLPLPAVTFEGEESAAGMFVPCVSHSSI